MDFIRGISKVSGKQYLYNKNTTAFGLYSNTCFQNRPKHDSPITVMSKRLYKIIYYYLCKYFIYCFNLWDAHNWFKKKKRYNLKAKRGKGDWRLVNRIIKTIK